MKDGESSPLRCLYSQEENPGGDSEEEVAPVFKSEGRSVFTSPLLDVSVWYVSFEVLWALAIHSIPSSSSSP